MDTHPKVVGDAVDYFRITPENTALESLSPFEIDALFETSREDQGQLLAPLDEQFDQLRDLLLECLDFFIEFVDAPVGFVNLAAGG